MKMPLKLSAEPMRKAASSLAGLDYTISTLNGLFVPPATRKVRRIRY